MIEQSEKNKEIRSLAVVRGRNLQMVKTTLYNLVQYGGLNYVDAPRICDPVFADNILVDVVKTPLKYCCKAAAIVPLADNASAAIDKVRKIHPPAHVIIVSPRHSIYDETMKCVGVLPEMDMILPTEQTADAPSGGL